MKNIILADNQELTKNGWKHILMDFSDLSVLAEVNSKAELFPYLNSGNEVLVIFDYVLFDFDSVHYLISLQNTYPKIEWILCSDELHDDFLRLLVSNTHSFSVLSKNTSIDEIKIALKEILKGNRYICNLVSNSLLQASFNSESGRNKSVLTSTEKEILKDIASGKTTKEIAGQRFVSIHTVMTHRKNIFRKIEVNNIHEATKYAMRAGLIDMADYYI